VLPTPLAIADQALDDLLDKGGRREGEESAALGGEALRLLTGKRQAASSCGWQGSAAQRVS